MLADRLSGKIVEDPLAVFSGNIGVHWRPSAVAEGFGSLKPQNAKLDARAKTYEPQITPICTDF
jgi:hypothetical protein